MLSFFNITAAKISVGEKGQLITDDSKVNEGFNKFLLMP